MPRRGLASASASAVTLCAWLCAPLALVSAGRTWSSSINSIFSPKDFEPGNLVTESVAAGAQLALLHCQQQFLWDRWNCPDSSFSRRSWRYPNRETAYVLALTAAGVAYSVSKNCTRGDIAGCGCERDLRGRDGDDGWKWGGCSDDIAFGESVSFQFLDALEEGADMQAFVNKHNMAAGRHILRQSMQRTCRCHGVSGSCSSKTCWMQMAPFQEVASQLRLRYDRAVRVGFERGRGVRALGNAVAANSATLVPPAISSEHLLYIDDSPDYCLPDPHTGWAGTKGRLCSRAAGNASRSQRRSCRALCRECGHRVQRQARELVWRCNCTFHWCCDVACQTCRKTVTDRYCT